MLIAALCTLLVSCDANKGKVEEVANKFVAAVASNDSTSISELYPSASNATLLKLVDTINADEIKVEFNETDSTYTARLNDSQILICKVESTADNTTVKIVDSRNILVPDSTLKEFAAKIGAPINELTDIQISVLFNEDYDFMYNLTQDYLLAANCKLVMTNATVTWGKKFVGGAWNTYAISDIEITNQSEEDFKADDYSIRVNYWDKENGGVKDSAIYNGKDIKAGETIKYKVDSSSVYYLAESHKLTTSVDFFIYNSTIFQRLLKYAEFSGNEYESFMNSHENWLKLEY